MTLTKKTTASSKSGERLWYLDNLKVFLTILVVFHHAGQAYGEGGAWPYHPSLDKEYITWLGNFFPVNASFFMGLFFLMSGYLLPASYDSHTHTRFLKEKLLRWGVPMLIVFLICSGLGQKPEFAHVWYIEHLLFYTLLYILWNLSPLGKIRCRDKKPTLLLLCMLACALSLANWLIRKDFPIDSWTFLGGFLQSEPAHLPQYLLMFTLGILSYRLNWFNRIRSRDGVILLAAGLFLALLVYLRPVCGFLRSHIWRTWYWYEAFLCISLSFGLLCFFRNYLNVSSPFSRWLARQAYGVYLVHLFLIVMLQYLFDSLWLGSGVVKFLFIAVLSTALSFVITWLLRLIPGVKRII